MPHRKLARNHTGLRREWSNRRGAVIVLVALFLPVLLVLVGFSVDLANMQRVRTEMRVATDLSAKAAAEILAQTGDQAAARNVAKQVAAANTVAGKGLTLSDSDFEFGKATRQASGKWTFAPASSDLNSVRVSSARATGSTDGPIDLFFGKFYGRSTFEPEATAVAAFVNVDICLVLDRSTSMKLALTESGGMYITDPRWCSPPNGSAKWKDLDTAVGVFIDKLEASAGNENVAVVTFGGPMFSGADDCSGTADHSIVSVDRTFTTNLSLVEAAVSSRMSMIWNGNTDIEAGMIEGINVLAGARPGARRVMILLTDGQYTEANPVPQASVAASNDITIHTVTFGDLPAGSTSTWITDMQTIAATANGKHLHAPTKQALNDAFADLAASVTVLIQ